MTKILIVDDEVDICEMMSFTFDSQGYETLVAYDATEAFAMVKSHDPDLVISDIRMPQGGGMKLLEDIKRHNTQRPLVFLITGYSDKPKELAIAAGAEDVLTKPIKLQDLLDRVKRVLESKGQKTKESSQK